MKRSFPGKLKFFLSYSDAGPSSYIAIVVLNLAKGVPFHAIPILIKLIIDTYIPTADTRGIFLCALAALGCAVLNVLFHSAFNPFLQADILQTAMFRLQLDLIRKLQSLEQAFYDRSPSGLLFSKVIVSVRRLGQFSHFIFSQLLDSLILTLIAVGVLIIVEPKLLLISLVIAPLFILFRYFFQNRLEESYHEVRKVHEDFSQSVSAFIQTGVLTRLHGAETFESRKVGRKNQRVVEASREVVKRNALFTSLSHCSNQTLYCIVIALAAWYVIKGKLLLGELLLFMHYLGVIVNFLFTIISQYPDILQFSESVDAVDEVFLSDRFEQPLGEERRDLADIKGDVTFDDMSFAYTNAAGERSSDNALSDISITFKAGTTVGLVGESGSGKSTFVKMILGLYRPSAGKVLVDGHDLQTLDLKKIRRFFGVVSQDPILFPGTVTDNITYGRSCDSIREVMRAAEKAYASDFINELPEKFESKVQESGSNFSGGQKQRLTIARALFRKPRILVFDEATSALDTESENRVQAAIEGVSGEQTTFVIAHRLSTIFRADTILVFDRGRIVAQGTHNELIEGGGIYTELLCEQVKLPPEELYKLKV